MSQPPIEIAPSTVEAPARRSSASLGAHPTFRCPRVFVGNKYVYFVISPRARGLSIGINLNPEHNCNFDCVYCEVERTTPNGETVNLDVLAHELHTTLVDVSAGLISRIPEYANLPPDLLKLRHIAISGDGEPTLCPVFADAVRVVSHIRATGDIPFFKIVLITNGSRLHEPHVKDALRLLTRRDDIWIKLDGGTEGFVQRVNRPTVPLGVIHANIAEIARQRPIVIQTLFAEVDGEAPSAEEIGHYTARLNDLKAAGGQISLVQIYSATRPIARPNCSHLPLRTLSAIADMVRRGTGLRVEVF